MPPRADPSARGGIAASTPEAAAGCLVAPPEPAILPRNLPGPSSDYLTERALLEGPTAHALFGSGIESDGVGPAPLGAGRPPRNAMTPISGHRQKGCAVRRYVACSRTRAR